MKISCYFLFVILLLFSAPSLAQMKDTIPQKKDSNSSLQNKRKTTDSLLKKRKDTVPVRDTNSTKPTKDSAFIPPQKPSIDSFTQSNFSSIAPVQDTVVHHGQNSISSKSSLTQVLAKQQFFNVNQPSVFVLQHERIVSGKEIIFYTLCGLLLILGIFKTLYKNYFNNLFRLFFNTSLRQSQLTEQLMQAQWPSFFLNIFFFISASLYLSLLWQYYSFSHFSSWEISLLTFFAVISGIYLIKFLVLKFIGWITGIQNFTNNYIFIIFLINKVAGLLLLPFIIFLSFTHATALKTVFTISFLLLIFLVLIRYLKSFSNLDKKVTVSRFHFLLYIIGGEILPVLVLYKIATDYLGYT